MAKIDKLQLGETIYDIGAKSENVSYGDGNVKAKLDSLSSSVEEIQEELETTSGDYSVGYGMVGQKKPSQVAFIKDVLDNYLNLGGYNWRTLNFIHISDSHDYEVGHAYELLDNVGAEFIMHTGDLVNSYSSNYVNQTLQRMLQPAKRCYAVIGNHDRDGESNMANVYNKLIKPFVDRYGSGSQSSNLVAYEQSYMNDESTVISGSRTYYSFLKVAGTTSNPITIRCIVINEYETSVTSVNPGFKMSDAQILWFINELKTAANNKQHVIIFAHQTPKNIVNMDVRWNDAKSAVAAPDWGDSSAGLCALVDAFIKKTSASNISICGNSYSMPAQSYAGNFIGWFVGHSHCDMQGYIEGYPEQHVCSVPRAEGKSNIDGDHTIIPDSQFRDKWNYVKVNPGFRTVTIYRVGNQLTFHGFKRDVLTYKY